MSRIDCRCGQPLIYNQSFISSQPLFIRVLAVVMVDLMGFARYNLGLPAGLGAWLVVGGSVAGGRAGRRLEGARKGGGGGRLLLPGSICVYELCLNKFGDKGLMCFGTDWRIEHD